MDNKGDVAGTATPVLLKVAGKEFDISTPEGKMHAEAWGDAIAGLVGRQGNEVGELRKFKSEHAPTDDETKLLTTVAELREQGEHAQADKLLFGFVKETSTKAQRRLEAERANDKTWQAYLKDRPELAERFDVDIIRKVSETSLGETLYKAEDPFAALDALWKVQPKAPQKANESDKPPVVLPGGAGSATRTPAAKLQTPPQDDGAVLEDLNSFLDSLGKTK